jgi:hypothetical protein
VSYMVEKVACADVEVVDFIFKKKIICPKDKGIFL